jgi:hypothetical protein
MPFAGFKFSDPAIHIHGSCLMKIPDKIEFLANEEQLQALIDVIKQCSDPTAVER